MALATQHTCFSARPRAVCAAARDPMAGRTWRAPAAACGSSWGRGARVSSSPSIGVALHPPATRKLPVVCAAAQDVASLPPSLQKIVGAFQMVPDPMARYKQLLFFATKLAPLPPEDHIPENKVQGCVSQVWVVPRVDADGRVQWAADSDSQLTKGLAALLVNGLSGCTPEEIVRIDPSFIDMLGLTQALTPSRNNGFLNMFKLMQRKSLELLVQQSKQDGDVGQEESSGPGCPSSAGARVMAFHVLAAANAAGVATDSDKPVRAAIRRKLTEALQPIRLDIVDESDKHAGHVHMMQGLGKAGAGTETHFRLTVVSPAFESKTMVQRHRMIYAALAEEMRGSIHALALDTKTPAEANM